ncbi:MAG: S8/S53 family peptidase [Myxococcales bacterium]|nr:S8/S53 family peptidase [Myxococcales bacterium]
MSDLRPNRRVSIPALALVFAAALAGCGGEELVGTLEKASGSLVKATTTKSTASLAPAAPPAWRYVALVKRTASDPCPQPLANGWQVRPLFRQGATQLLLEGGKLPAAIERFCEYSWTQAPQDPASAPAFSAADAGKIVRIDPDRDLVIPQTLPASQVISGGRYLGGEADVRRNLSTAYRTHAGALPAASVPKEPSGAPIVAVVDTVGFGDAALDYGAVTARLQHGLAIAGFVRDVRCPDGESGCRGRLFHAQAFPYSKASPLVDPGGGPLGSLGSLARALGESVVRWRRMPNTKGPLIVNLSLGWDPELADLGALAPASHMDLLKGQTTTVPATVQAVHAGIAWAACNQALVVAAAGNNIGAPCSGEGPLAPASWERLPSASAALCAQLFGADQVTAPAGDADTGGGSLVYAAAGLTYGDAPLPNARAGSLPGRALPAFHAVSESVRGRTDGWTGSSVAAATLSGLAARAWAIAPGLTPQALIQAIDPSGVDLGRSADLHRYDRQAPQLRRIAAQPAFAAVCSAGGVSPCPNPYAALGPSLQSAVSSAMSLKSHPAVVTAPRLTPQRNLDCKQRTLACGVTLSACGADAAPPTAPTATQPWTRPQPDTPICPVCPIDGGELIISPNPTTTTTGSITLSAPQLRLRFADGSWLAAELADIQIGTATVRVDLSGYRVEVGGVVSTIDQLIATRGVSAGELEFTVPDESGRPSAMTSDLAVVP